MIAVKTKLRGSRSPEYLNSPINGFDYFPEQGKAKATAFALIAWLRSLEHLEDSVVRCINTAGFDHQLSPIHQGTPSILIQDEVQPKLSSNRKTETTTLL